MTGIDIRNCKFAYRCNQRWEHLEPVVGRSDLRYCTRCSERVHLVDSEARFAELARQGRCVAVLSAWGEPTVGVPKGHFDGVD